MTELSARFADEAERLAGSPFRLHGRDPHTGLDCVGLVVCALGRAGGSAAPPAGYALRNIDVAGLLTSAGRSGFRIASGALVRGDLLLVQPGPSQHHLIIALGKDRIVHAHAGLRRVVCQTGLAGWPIRQHWRLPTQSE